MKFLLIITMLLVALMMTVQAQDKTIAEIVKSSENIVKGAPFSAEAISESVQVLSDGNKISRKTVTKMYRDSEGRFRRDDMPNPGGILGSVVKFPQTLFIIDPMAGIKYYLNQSDKTARQQVFNKKVVWDFNHVLKFEFEKRKAIEMERKKVIENKNGNSNETYSPETIKKSNPPKEQIQEQKEKIEEEKRARQLQNEKRQAEMSAMRAEINAARVEVRTKQADISAKRAEKNAEQATKNNLIKLPDNPISFDTTKTESLGVKSIEGVQAEGTRTVSTIAAGAIGNDQAIDIVYERWYSKDLQLIIFSKHNDPRFGEQTYRLTNISRNEPDRSLFAVPADYKIVNPFPPKALPAPATLKPLAVPAKPSPPSEKVQ